MYIHYVCTVYICIYIYTLYVYTLCMYCIHIYIYTLYKYIYTICIYTMYVLYTYVYIYTLYVYTLCMYCIHIYVYIYIHICVYTLYVYTLCMYCIHMYIYIYIYTIYIYTLYVYTLCMYCIHIYVYIYIYTHMCIYTMYVLDTYIYIYIHICVWLFSSKHCFQVHYCWWYLHLRLGPKTLRTAMGIHGCPEFGSVCPSDIDTLGSCGRNHQQNKLTDVYKNNGVGVVRWVFFPSKRIILRFPNPQRKDPFFRWKIPGEMLTCWQWMVLRFVWTNLHW